MGDFAIFPGADCDQFIPFIETLAILAIIILPFALMFAFRVLYVRIRDGMNFSNPLVQVPISISLFLMCNLVFSILKLADPVRFIMGKSIVATTLNSVGTCALTHAFFTLTRTLTGSFKQYLSMMRTESQNAFKEVRKLIDTASILITVGVGIVVAAPFFIVWYPSTVQPLCGVFSAGTGVMLCLVLYCQMRAINVMIPELEQAIGRSQSTDVTASSTLGPLEKLLKKLKFQKSLNSRNTPFAILLYLIFGLWPFLQRKQTYFLMMKIVLSFAQCVGTLFFIAPSSTFTPLDQLSPLFKRNFGKNSSDGSQDPQSSQSSGSKAFSGKILGSTKIHTSEVEKKIFLADPRAGCDEARSGGGDYTSEFTTES